MPITKIVILDTGKEWGGGTNSMLEMLKRADRDKYRFTALFCHNYSKGPDSDIKKEMEKLEIEFILLKQKEHAGTVKLLKEIVRVLSFFNDKLRKYLLFRIDYVFRIRESAVSIAGILKEMKAGLLYLNNQPSSNLEGILASEIAGVPALQHCRKVAPLNAFEVKTANRVLAGIICVSKGLKNEYIEQGITSSKCIVIHNGIDPQTEAAAPAQDIRKKWGISEDEILTGTASSLLRGKRIDDILEIFSIARNASPKKVKCMIVGDGPEKQRLLNIAAKKGIMNDTVFTGFQKDAVSLINAMDIFIMASEKEGFPRALLEAMLMGRAAAAFDVTGVSELIVDGDTGYLIPSGDIPAFGKALIKLITDDDLRIRFGERGRRRVIDNFSVGRYIKEVENVFDEIAKPKAANNMTAEKKE
ncbi:MAG: glycosyltransferase family 4 protein [Nitrospirae bacterium]|nr:glycosyltransferase family 4 protein [Nitrospirota bacterium]